MRWNRSIRWINALMLSGALTGCHPARTLHYFGEAELGDYRSAYQEIEYPNVDQPTPPEVVNSTKPRTVKAISDENAWDMTLQEALHLAIANNKMIRLRDNSVQLLLNPLNTVSVYDPAIRQTGFLFGNRGVEAALADFDTYFTTALTVGRNQSVVNQNTLSAPEGFILNNNNGAFTSQLQKIFATGGTFTVNHNWNYLGTNAPSVLFNNSYTGLLQAQFTQPLWGASGVEYTRIAGPNRAGLGAITGVSQGVAIARINEDITVADFELLVQNMIRDVENLYWELFLAYRQYDAGMANQESALRSWREVKAKMDIGAVGGNASAEAQAREFYFEARAAVESQLNNIYDFENQLRSMLGLGVNDGRIIRPADAPVSAEFLLSWEQALSEALTRRVELRRQKWNIKALELEQLAARNAANPQLNFISSYQLNGFGHQLLSQNTSNFNSAYGTLNSGDLTGWTLGLQLAMPLGLRTAYAQLHNIELQLLKARAGLATSELVISHDLAQSMQSIDVAFKTAQSNFDRRVASEARVEATMAEYEAEIAGATLDLVLRAQASRAASEIAYFTSLVQYNQAINELNYRRGTILERNNIHLSEGEWIEEAQEESLRRSWARAYGREHENLETRPAEYASPVPYPKTDLFPGQVLEQVPPAPSAEPVPADDPIPTLRESD
ncbi:MAG: TolC family protein [Planctomycetaceae bacterium]